MSTLHIGLACVACGVALAAQSAEPPRIVNGWAALIQAVHAMEEYVATSELSAIHNEDAALATAITVLREETAPVSPAARPQLADTLTAFGQQIGNVHQAADAFDAPATRTQMRELLRTYERLRRFYGEETLTPARRLAAVYACPMHRDVVGQRTGTCSKCGMALDYAVRIQLAYYGLPEYSTVRARIRLDQPLQAGRATQATLHLGQIGGGPILITDLRVVHTERIHLLIVDPSLTDYHHVHPQPTTVPGAYAFSFTPARPGPYRAWADLRTTYGGFQEFAAAEIPAPKAASAVDRTGKLDAEVEGLRYALMLDQPALTAGEPVRARLRVTDRGARPFTRLEPIMGTFAHLVAFHENWKTVLHIHPSGTKALAVTDRGGPELAFQLYATEPGFYRLFAQVQIGGTSTFIPFGLHVAASRGRTTVVR
ncbi:MAG: heavy metal-binding domain-containing protein [Vicinamibacterales bacterium]